MMRRFLQFAALGCLLLASATVFAQAKRQITVEWIYSDKSGDLTAVPRFMWLDDNTAILQDPRKPAGARTLERFSPAKGSRTPAVDAAKALSSLRSMSGSASVSEDLPWPSAINSTGTHALYRFDGDLYLLDLNASAFSQMTDTKVAETSANFSPDGARVAFVRNNDMYVYDIEKRTERRLTFDGSETTLNGTLSWVYWEELFGRRDIGYWWSEDSRAIAYLQTDESMVSLMHFVDYEPAVPRLIKQRYPKTGTVNPVVRVGVVELEGGGTTWANIHPADYEYVARVKWLPDSRRYSVQTMTRDQTELVLHFVDRRSGEASHILRETDPAWVNVTDDLYFLRDGKHFLWQSERDGYAHLYRFRMDGTLVNQVTKGEWALRSSGGPFWLRQSVVAIDEKRSAVYFTSLKASSIERQLYRVRLDGKKLQQISRKPGTHRVTFSPAADYYLDRFSDTRTPTSLTLHDRNGKLKQTVSPARTDLLETLSFQYPELMTIPTSDGFQMPAELLKPADFDPSKKWPVIFHIYGGPSAPTVQNRWNPARYFDQILLRNGYLVVRFDHRAATAISKELENTVNLMMGGPAEMQDLTDGVRWLKSQPWVDGSRFGIWGWSGGGTFTLSAMTHTKEFKAGISVAPVTDWHYYDTKFGELTMKRPQDNPEGYEKTSVVQRARNLNGRLLLVQGTYDDNVHPQNAWRFIEELVQANIQFEMMFYPMRKHGISDRPARIHLYTKMLAFWNEHL